MQIPIAVTLEQANLMTADAPEAEQNNFETEHLVVHVVEMRNCVLYKRNYVYFVTWWHIYSIKFNFFL